MTALPLLDQIERVSRYAVQDVCAARHKGSETSEVAFDDVREGRETQRLRVLAYVQGRGATGATVEEIALALSARYTSMSARCAELTHNTDGRLVVTKMRRATTSGSAARVLVARVYAPDLAGE